MAEGFDLVQYRGQLCYMLLMVSLVLSRIQDFYQTERQLKASSEARLGTWDAWEGSMGLTQALGGPSAASAFSIAFTVAIEAEVTVCHPSCVS